jgi:hypothetical protein
MAFPRLLASLGKAALVAAVVIPPTAIWLSGRFAEDAERDFEPPAPAPRATLARSEPPATPASRIPPAPDSVPTPAPPVTVGPGTVTVPPPVPGAAPVPEPRAGQVVGEPQGLPDPNRSEAQPR